MRHLRRGALKGLALGAAVLFFNVCAVLAQQSLGTLRGNVKDELGGVIIGAQVTATDAAGVEKTTETDEQGNYSFAGLAPGRYTVRINQGGFAPYENLAVEVQAGRTEPLNITLTVAIEQEEVTVTAEAPVGTEAESQAGAVVLRGDDLDALPDDPDDLSEALQALAGPGAGSSEDGAQIYVDGFTGGRLPPKESIREIRINRNPFSAEYDRLGYGRVEIFTKPGTDKYRGQAFFNFNDESLNARSPFATTRAPYQSRRYGGNISGPLSAKRASFFLDFERRETDDNEVVRAVVLDAGLNPLSFNQTILTPDRHTTFSPRLDYQLNPTNTLVARYTFEQGTHLNEGVSDFNLPTRAYDVENSQQTAQLTETAVISGKVINETRFQFERDRRRQEGGNNLPVVRVLESFTGGGAQNALSSNDQDRFELQNYTSWTVGVHSLKAGARLRADRVRDVSQQNFAGTFTFAGGNAPQLNAAGNIIRDASGNPLLVQITSLERYRRTLLFAALGNAEVRARGGGPTQFSVSGGDPEASVTYWDFSPFIQDDWRVRPNLTLSAGLRYERQNLINSSNLDFAPRVAFAWSPAADPRKQKTVVRGGFGIFFQRVNENLALQAVRSNGTNQQQFVVSDTSSPFLNQSGFTLGTVGGVLTPTVSNVPTPAQLTSFQVRQTIRQLAPDIRAPYTMQTAFSVEQQLPYRISLSISYIGARTLHALRSRNINAPLLDGAGLLPRTAAGAAIIVRPDPTRGNVNQFESSGVFNQHQLVFNVNNRFSRKFTLFGNYVLNFARSDTDYAANFPINQYDLSGEYGNSGEDQRHRVFIGGAINALPWGLRLNPTLVANSGRPFNITLGRDLNGDSLFTERPAFATDLSRVSVRRTAFGDFDTEPLPGQTIIPRNYGRGPGFFSVNMRMSKTIGFGEMAAAGAGGAGGGRAGRGGGGGGRGGGGRGGGGRGGGGRGGGGGGGESLGGGESTEHRYNLTLSLSVQNLFNHTSLSTPVGNLNSPFFGQSVAGGGRFGFGGGGGGQNGGSRRVDLQLRFSF